MTTEFKTVGKRITQKDVVLKATGEGIYVPDVNLPGQLWGKVLHSPHAHANIKKIDKSKAEALPGVKCVITFEDTPKILYARSFRDQPLGPSKALQRSDEYIINDKCRYWGDAIAAVAAVDEETAEKALGLIDVEYEVLPFVLDPREAVKPGAPVIQDWCPNNVPVSGGCPPFIKKGDVKKGFEESDVVVEGTFFSMKQVIGQLEPQSCVANYDTNGRITIYSPCQLAHPFRRELAKMFGVGSGMITVNSTAFVGGSFGCRLSCHNEPIAIMLSKVARKPVKIIYSKEEDFCNIDSRTPDYVTCKVGMKKDGTLHSLRVDTMAWASGYLSRAMLAGSITLVWGMGHYRCNNIDGSFQVVYTNTPLSGAMRGFGNPEVMWAVDQLMHEAAVKLGLDPVEVALKNAKKPGEASNMGGLPLESTYIEDCIKQGAEAIGWKEKYGKNKGGTATKKRGVGISTMTHCSDGWPLLLAHSGAIIKFNEDGTIHLICHPGSPGTHIWGSLSQVAAETIGIPVEDVHISGMNTDVTVFDLGSHASRSMYVTGNAVKIAAQKAKKELLDYAAKMMVEDPDDLDVDGREIYVKSNPPKRISVREVAHEAIFGARGDGYTPAGIGCWNSTYSSPPTAAYFAEVEVDTETYEVKVLKFVTAMDCGKAINPMSVEGQCEGGIQNGLGAGLTENYVYDEKTGKPLSLNYTTYKMPGALDMPDETKIIIIDKPDPKGPYGAKGVGEPALVGIAPAIANAVYDAIGVRIYDQPITPEKILKAMKEKAGK